MRRILQRHGIQHASATEHIESLPDDAPLHQMLAAVSRCARTWFAPGESYYMPMCSTNWGLQRADPGADADHLTIKRIAFMNAGAYLRDAVAGGAKRGPCRTSLINNLAYHSRRYAAALHDFLLRHPAVARCDCEADPPRPRNRYSELLFRWTRVETDTRATGRLCEYTTRSALDECVLAWCTAVATRLTLGQYAEASTAAHMMTSMMMDAKSGPEPHHRYHVNAFSPPLMDIPCALVVTVRDAVALIRDVSGDDAPRVATRALSCRSLISCFDRGAHLSCLPCHVKGLCMRCARVLRGCDAFLCIRGLLREVKEKWDASRDAILSSYGALQETASIAQAREDYVGVEMAKLDIALAQRQGGARAE